MAATNDRQMEYKRGRQQTTGVMITSVVSKPISLVAAILYRISFEVVVSMQRASMKKAKANEQISWHIISISMAAISPQRGKLKGRHMLKNRYTGAASNLEKR